MWKRQVQPDMETPKSNSENTRGSGRANDDGKIDPITRRFLKVLTGLSIGQMVMIAITAATLGAFVNYNMKEIEALKKTTENMQEKINLLAANQDDVVSPNQSSENETKWEEIDTKITDFQTRYETEFLELSNNLTVLEAEPISRKSADAILDTRLTHLESVIDNYTQHYGERLIHLETDTFVDATQVSRNITEFQNQISIHKTELLDHESRLTQIEVDMTSDNTFNDSKMDSFTTRITQLEADNINITDSLRTDIRELYTRISEIESDEVLNRALTTTLNNSIAELEVDFIAQMQEIRDQNSSIIQVKENIEINSHSIQNTSDRLSVLDAEIQMNTAEIIANNERLSQIGNDINTTMTLHYDLDSKLSLIESKIGAKSAFAVTNLVTGKVSNVAYFNQEVTNIGGHYDTRTGTFTCEYPGIYVFSMNIVNVAMVDCEIRKNQSKVTRAFHSPNDGGIGYFSISASVVVQLSGGDEVNVYCQTGLDPILPSVAYFSGFLSKAV